MKQLLTLLWTFLYATIFFAQNRPHRLTVTDGLPNNQVRQVVELPNGQMLVETEGMFALFNGKYFVTLNCNLDSVRNLTSFGCHDHLWQGDSLLWMKDFYALYLFDTRTRKFIYEYDRYEETEQLRHFIMENGDSVTHARLQQIEHLQPLLDSLTAGSDIQGEQLNAYQRDRQGGQWFGTLNGGIVYLPPKTQTIRIIPSPTDDVIRRIMSIDRRTMIMAGEQGIYLFDCEQECFTQTLTTGSIHCAEMSRDGQGRIWLATKQGLYCYDHGKLLNYNQSNTKGFIHNHMRFALPLDESRLLVCNYMHELGFFYPHERRMEMINQLIPSLSDYRTMIAATMLQNKNKVAVCTQNGCFVLDVARLQKEELDGIQAVSGYSHKYNCLLLDRNGNLWMGTQNGLLMLNNNQVRRVTCDDGLSNMCIQSLAEDSMGNIWVGTSNGINRIQIDNNTQTLNIRSIGTDNGLPAVEMTERGICLMPDGTLFLTTPVGLVRFHTSDFQAKVSSMPTVMVGINVAGKEMLLDTLPLQLNYRQNYIDLQVSALNYAQPSLMRYRFRVSETDNEWHTIADNDGRLATIRLSDLKPGTYTVEVQTSMGDNIWGQVLRKTFIINPPLWFTWWAKLLYFLIATAIIMPLAHWYITTKKEKLRRENEQRVNQLFELREEARHQFAQSVEINPERITTNNEEKQLIERIMKAIGQNMSNTDYTVDMLARDIGMSRANLYKKMQTMLGVTPNDFMRNVRLKRAAEMLAKSDVPVNQLALMVGFQTPRYFSQCFRKMFGVTPSEYREGKSPTTNS